MLLRRASLCIALSLIGSLHPAFAADQALIDAAKKEGQLTWYTTQIVNELVVPMADAFQKKYGIKINYVRAGTSDNLLRVYNEAKAGSVQADVVDGIGLTPLEKAGLAEKYQPDSAKHLPPEYLDKDGYWVATNLFVHIPAYNTELVPRDSAPKTLQDLLDPKWTGKMAWGVNPGPTASPSFVGLVLSEMGEDKGMAYLKALAKQQITPLGGSARDVVDMLIAGEYSIAINVDNSHVANSKKQGAPVEWIKMQPALGFFSITELLKGSPHPNAGKLFVDFQMSKEGQQLFADTGYLPVDPDVAPRDPSMRPDGTNWRIHYIMPDEVDETVPHWWNIYESIFR